MNIDLYHLHKMHFNNANVQCIGINLEEVIWMLRVLLNLILYCFFKNILFPTQLASENKMIYTINLKSSKA